MHVNKYLFYEKSAQDAFSDLRFIEGVLKKAGVQRRCRVLREDFCGTGLLANLWIKSKKERHAHAVDISVDPIAYGIQAHTTQLPPKLQKKLNYLQSDVRSPRLPRADLAVAFNFSYMTFHSRTDLMKYFRNVHRSLGPKGFLFLDCFGGSSVAEMDTLVRKNALGTYMWDCVTFNPISSVGHWSIHWKPKGRKKMRDVFMYHWRLWTPMELQEALRETGFEVEVYWEKLNSKGRETGVFESTNFAISSRQWICYIVAQKKSRT